MHENTDKIEIIIANTHAENVHNMRYVNEFFELRKQVFVDDLKWEIATHKGMEFEQYDTLGAYYILAISHGKVVAGTRLCSSASGATSYSGRLKYSYMLRDAWLGLLPGLPKELCLEEPPVSNKVWELTRLVCKGGIAVLRDLLDAVLAFLYERGVERCLCLSTPVVQRLARSMGFNPIALGELVDTPEGKIIAFSCDVKYIQRNRDVERLRAVFSRLSPDKQQQLLEFVQSFKFGDKLGMLDDEL